MFKVAFITAKKRLSAYPLQTAGVDIGVLSLDAYLLQYANDVLTLVSDEPDDIIKYRPDLLAVSSTSENYPLAITIAKKIKKETNCIAIIGGVHITACPESLDSVFDAAVIGEGEETLLELVRLYKDGRPQKGLLKKVHGIAYMDGGKVQNTAARRPIVDMGKIPIPRRRLWVENIGMAYLMSSRGCPYKCWFCASCRFWGGVRFYPVRRVIDEIQDIIDSFHPKAIRFFDDIFTLEKRRAADITSLMIREGLTKSVGYLCWMRAELVDDEYARILSNANFVHAALGIESASERLMKKLKGETISLRRVQSAIDVLSSAGINVGLTFIIGTPGETAKDLDATYDFIVKNMDKILDVEINPLIPFPSTPLWRYAEKKGLVHKEMDWGKLSDTGIILNFDFDKYIYLNDAMPRAEFLSYVEKFKGLFRGINLRKKNFEFSERTFPSSLFPSRLKRLT